MEREQSKLSDSLEQSNKDFDTSGKEFNDAEKQADQFGKEIKNSAEQADDASNRFEKLGGVLKGIGAGLAVGVLAIGTAAIGAGKALVDMTVNSSAYADEILTQATVTGMSTESLQAYKYAAELVDVSLDTLTGSMSKQVKSMSSARDGSASFVDAYSKLGVAVADSNGNLRDSDTVYWETIDALGKMKSGAIIANLPLIIDSAVQIIMTLLQSLISALPQITAGAVQLVMALLNGIIENLPMLVEGAIQMILTLVTGIAAALPQLIPAIVNAIILISETLLANMDKILAAAFQIIEGLAVGLINALPGLIDKLPQIISGIIDFLLGSIPQIVDMGLKLFTALVEALPEIIVAIVKALPQIIGSIVQGLANAVPQLVEAGANLLKGLWKGLNDTTQWLWEKLSGFCGDMVDKFKDFFGIHSPSTVFAGFGGYMAKGLGIGFGKEMNKVSTDMQNAIPTDFEMNANVNGSYSSNKSSVGTQSSPIYVYSEIKLDAKTVGHVITPIVSQNLAFAARGGLF